MTPHPVPYHLRNLSQAAGFPPTGPQQFSHLWRVANQLTLQTHIIERQRCLCNETQTAIDADIKEVLREIAMLQTHPQRSISTGSTLLDMPPLIQRKVVFLSGEFARLQEVDKALTARSIVVWKNLLRVTQEIQQIIQQIIPIYGPPAQTQAITTTNTPTHTAYPYRNSEGATATSRRANHTKAPRPDKSRPSGIKRARFIQPQAERHQPILCELLQVVRRIANASTIQEARQITALLKRTKCLSEAFTPTNNKPGKLKYLAIGLWKARKRFSADKEDFLLRYSEKREELIELTNQYKPATSKEDLKTLNSKRRRIELSLFKLLLGQDRLDLIPEDPSLQKMFINQVIYNEIQYEKRNGQLSAAERPERAKRKAGDITSE